MSIVLSVIAIIVFIGSEALPLLSGAQVSGPRVHPDRPALPVLQWVDEYRAMLGQVGTDGLLRTIPLDSTQRPYPPVRIADTVFCGAKSAHEDLFALGVQDGSCQFFRWRWRVTYDSGRQVQAVWQAVRAARLFDSAEVKWVQVAQRESGALVAFAASGRHELVVYSYDPEWDADTRTAVLAAVAAGRRISCLALDPDGRIAVVGYDDGHILVVDCTRQESPEILQFTRVADTAITAMTFLLGGQSLAIGDAAGGLSRYLAVLEESGPRRPFRLIDTYGPAGAGIQGLVLSPRDKGFVAWDSSGAWTLQHAPTGRTYLQVPSAGEPCRMVSYAPKADAVVATLHSGGVASWDVSNPHPEATLSTLFGKVWYEGYHKPEFVWQSTGGTDEFEPKLSLVPLLFGTLKGTFYAMLFSVPVSILAAIYVSQLARPGFRSIVKPAIELMAALPSVVVGFLAALWLAPLIERHLIASILTLLAVPLFAVLAAPVWQLLPERLRDRLPEGIEPAVAIPFIALGAASALLLAPVLESAWFAGDVRQWLFVEQGIRFDPRNNIVVGVALGVAVIPIIFTMSEDALSNVPPSLVSGALALGASRWQATWRIVLKAASPGIFAAVMLGFGRAVGETMIVLMATGNTPILDWSIFNGMRTMSAAIAVEIPEAPQGGTLYRVLFFTAFLLFLFTLAVNSVASVVSARLRRRYGRF